MILITGPIPLVNPKYTLNPKPPMAQGSLDRFAGLLPAAGAPKSQPEHDVVLFSYFGLLQ